jgi:Fibronectin type III domain
MKPNSGRLLIWGLIILVCSAFEVEAAGVTLAWDPASSPNIAGYRLHSGTTSGVYSQTSELGNATSTLVSNLVTGKTYFFVVTAYNTMGVESAPSNEVSYLAPSPSATPTPTPSATPTFRPPTTGPSVMLNPPPGSTFTSSSVTFTWSAGTATANFLIVGSSLHGADIYNSGIVTVRSKTVNNIPADGRTIYVTLASQVNGSWSTKDYTYKAFNPSATLTPAPTPVPTPTPTGTPTPTATPTPTTGPPVMLSPPPGSTFGSSSVTFTWSAGSATNYFLFVGSSLHGADIYNSGIVTVHSKTVNNIPTDGRTVYVTLGSLVNGSWTFNSYTYKAF